MRVKICLGKGFFPLLFSSLLMVLCLTGCAENSSILDNGQSRQLEFFVSTHNWSDFSSSNKSSDQKVPSRATPISESTFDTSKSFNVIADVNKGSNWSTEVDNETASYSTANDIWKTATVHYWPEAGSTVNFYAYYPTSISSSITHIASSAPVLSYTVPDNTMNQIDILASSKTGVAGDSYNQTPVDFKHIFAAVQFRVGSSGMINGTITRISLNGIQNTGSYSFTSGWTPQTSITTTYTKNVSAANDAGTEIVSGNDPFLVMPQTLSNASFTVTYSGGATLTKNLSGTWEAGKVYEYNINSSFSATQDFNYTENVQSYTVPLTGTYKLEVWGGGSNKANTTSEVNDASIGLGGYAIGEKRLISGTKLYICVGGAGATNSGLNGGLGGYNGGGKGEKGVGYAGGSGGGGATHISTTNRGLLCNYTLYKKEILIVAGGSGGSAMQAGTGSGGGLDGGNALTAGWSATGVASITINGGTQDSGYAFGKGQDGNEKIPKSSMIMGAEGNGGGGGGWYGGRSFTGTGDGSCCGGSGGSGYISGVVNGQTIAGNSSMPAPAGGTETGHAGNGYARITFISAN